MCSGTKVRVFGTNGQVLPTLSLVVWGLLLHTIGMKKPGTNKFKTNTFTRRDHIFMAVVAALVFLKITVDAFSLYGNNLRDGTGIAWWVPFVEQYTSYIFVMLGLPFIIWAMKRFPLIMKTGMVQQWPKHIVYHFGFTLVFFTVHVLGFIGLRMLLFPLFGGQYAYGGWPQSIFLEYPLDLSTYLIIAVSYILISHLTAAKPDKEHAVELNCGSRSIWVKPSEILYAKAAGNYVDVVLKEKTHLVRSTLEDLQTLINGKDGDLRRIHRSTLVNPDHVRERSPAKNGSRTLTLTNGDNIVMSRRYAGAFD